MIFYEDNKYDFMIVNIHDGFSFFSHMHRHLELVLCIKGRMELTCERKSYELNEHSWLIVQPETEHSYVLCDNNTKGLAIVANPAFIPQLSSYFSKKIKNPVVDIEIPMAEYCASILKERYELGNERGRNMALEKGLLYVIVALLFEQCEFFEEVPAHHDDLCSRVLQYISDNFKEDVSLTDIAKNFGVNASYLSRMFNSKIGSGINAVINGYRIDYAKYLLTNTDRAVTDICHDSGFKTVRTFNRIFSQSEGMPPSDYRKSN